MARFDPDPAWLGNLKDKVVVLTGGATGIGRSTVQLLSTHGAHVIFGDVNTAEATKLVSTTSSSSSSNIHFQPCDVTRYADTLALFKSALAKHGRVDHAIANAGVIEHGTYVDPAAGIEGVEAEPTLLTLDVNLKGVLYFARIALAYLSHGQDKEKPSDKSLTLLSSVAGFKETPGIFVYQASKHGVLGLLRTLRLYMPNYPGVRLNAVCPGMTLTQMVDGIRENWLKSGAPKNEPSDVADVVVGLMVSGPGRRAMRYEEEEGGARVRAMHSAGAMDWEDESKGVTGRAIYVAGAKGWDIEEGLDRTEALWLGAEASGELEFCQRQLGIGRDWSKGDGKEQNRGLDKA